ncbi:MAG: hypothetical protein CL608_25735 [Anaerolineaceae bacterium]|nr:hypothetical protein [Anaerolineaceae bacterium]
MEKLIYFLVLLLLLAGCGGGTAVWQPNSTTPPRLDSPPPRLLVQPNAGSGELIVLDVVTGQKESRLVSPAVGLDEIISGPYQPVGDLLVNDTHFFNLTDGLAAPNGLWLVTAENGLTLWRVDGVQVTLSDTGDTPIWSPDGRWLAYRDADGVWAVDVMADLTPQLVSDTRYEPLAWSPDNRQLLLRQGETAVLFTIAAGQNETLRGVDASQIHGYPVWSPDGETIYARYGRNGTLDIESGHHQPDNIQARLVAIATDGRSSPLRDLLPDQQDSGSTDFLLAPDGDLLLVRHFVCRSEPGGLIPFSRTRRCTGALLLVETATGSYQTIEDAPLAGVMAWERPFPPVQFADLPTPAASTDSPGDTAFWQPTAAPGQNPATAVPFGEAAGRLGQQMTVMELLTGDDALALAQSAATDPPLLPPAPGYTYVAVRQQAGREAGQAAIYGSTNHLLLDDRLAAHGEVAWLDTTGAVLQELPYSAEEPATYWQLFILEVGARPWLLVSPARADNQPDLYYQLTAEDGGSAPPPAVKSLPVNEVGVAEAAVVGQTAVSSAWQMTLLDPAERPAANPGLVLVQIGYTAPPPGTDRLLTCLPREPFQGAAGSQVVDSDSLGSLPFQNFARPVCFLPGGEFRGWLLVMPAVGEETAVFRFTPPHPVPFGERLFTMTSNEFTE